MDGTLDKLSLSRAERHPEKAHRPDNPDSAQAGLDQGACAEFTGVRRDQEADAPVRSFDRLCQEAACPNIGECWKQKHATFMIMGEICTRPSPCHVATANRALNPHEPANVAEAVGKLGLGHVVVTSVDRDDLDDGGAGHCGSDHRPPQSAPNTTIEILTTDFMRKPGAIETVVASLTLMSSTTRRDGAAALSERTAGRPPTSTCALLAQGEGDRSSMFTTSRPGGRAGRDAGGEILHKVMDDLRCRRRFSDGGSVSATGT